MSETDEALQLFLAESADWLGVQSSQLAQIVRQATPLDMKKQLKTWVDGGQTMLAGAEKVADKAIVAAEHKAFTTYLAAEKVADKAIIAAEDKAYRLFKKATNRLGHWL